MSQSNVPDPKVAKKWIDFLIVLLTAIGSFIGGNVVAKTANIHMFNPNAIEVYE